MPAGRLKCICQLCTCGRHMCPHRKKESHLQLGDDETGKQKQQELREKRRKQRRQWDTNEETVSSTVDQENARKVLAEATTAVRVEDKGQSAVRRGDWSDRQVPKRMPIRPTDNLRFDGSADFTTIHQMDYTRKASNMASQSVQDGAVASETHLSSWDKRQVPKTLPIRKPDSLQLSGPISLETTHKSEYNEAVFEGKSSPERHSQRPRTSLKLSGEFQTDSSYQRAFTPKHAEDVVKVKKGSSLSMSHLKPEGEMNFDTTSLDYQAALTEKAKLESQNSDRSTAVKPKLAKPPSAINIPEVPLQDETTAVTDYVRWNVGKPERHRPSDTLQLGAGEEDANSSELARKVYQKSDTSNIDSALDEALWQVSRPVIRKPENNLKPEGSFDFATTHDDYSKVRDPSRYTQSNLETVREHTEPEPVYKIPAEDPVIANDSDRVNTAQEVNNSEMEVQSPINATSAAGTDENGRYDIETRSPPALANGREENDISPQMAHSNESVVDIGSPSGEQLEYLTWDQVRPKPIRPHSNLRQEGGMQFDTTNRREFIEKTSERVRGVRPKTTTRVAEGDFDATTVNQIMFSHDQGERVNPIRPKSNLHLENGQFAGETTNAREYQKWQIQRPSPIVHKPTLTQEGSIDFTTTNNTEFEEKHLERVHPIRPSTTNRISGEFDMTTTNQIMHGSLPMERVQKIVPQTNLRMSSGMFDSETTNRRQFQEYHVDRPKPIKPVPNLRQEGAMDFTTMNQLEFEEKPFEKVSQFRPQTSSKITGDFDGTTTNNLMYAPQPGERPHMIKPKGNLELEKGKFADDTTNHSEFQQWQQTKPQAVTPRNNLQQEGDIDFTTTNQVQYIDRPMERVTQIRPKTNPKITGEFDGTTTNRTMYQNIVGEKPKAIRPKTNIELERGNFNDETTNSREFQTWGYEKPAAIKPHSSIRHEGNMDFTTTNSLQFEGKTAERATQIRPTTATKVTGDFDGTTTNQMMFQQNNVSERVRGKRPSTNIHLESGRFEDQTTARREYQQWDVAKSQPIKPSETLTQEGNMDLTTSNQTEFGEKPIVRAEKIRPQTSSKITGDFDGTTTNQIMYQAQNTDKAHEIRPRDNIRLQSGEFKGETTNSQEYGYKVSNKSDLIKPKPSLAQEGDFDFVTSNQLEFEEKNIERVTKIRPKTLTKASDGKFYGTTTNQAMFQTPAMEVVHTVRPSTHLRVDEGAFQENTTVTDAYQQWKAERPRAFQLASSLRQEGDMSFETTNHSEFNQKSLERVQQIRPKTSSKIEGDFDSTTMNQIMFHQPEKLDRVKPIRHENNLHLESGKFNDETTTSREYRQWVRADHKIAVPKKKLQTAGIRTQRGRSEGRKDATARSEQNSVSTPKENGHEAWKVSNDDAQPAGNEKSASSHEALVGIKDTTAAAEAEQLGSRNEEAAMVSAERNDNNEIQLKSQAAADDAAADPDVSALTAGYGTKSPSKVKSAAQEGSTTNKTEYTHGASTGGGKMVNGGTSSAYESWKLVNGEREGKADVTADHQGLRSEAPMVKMPKRYKPADNLRIEHVPFDATSTSRTEYKKWEGRRSSSKRRDENLKQEGKMQFNTTSSDYSASRAGYHPNQAVAKMKRKNDLKDVLSQPGGSMEFSTTSQSSYIGARTMAGSRAKNLRPRSSLRLGGGAESSHEVAMSSTRSNPEISTRDPSDVPTSTSRASYVGHSTSRRIRANRPSTSQKVGEGAFDGQSTTRSTFKVPQENVKSRTIRPENHNILNGGTSFLGDTTYRSSFESVKNSHCPVIDLEAGRSSLVLNEEKNGHVYYAPRVQG